MRRAARLADRLRVPVFENQLDELQLDELQLALHPTLDLHDVVFALAVERASLVRIVAADGGGHEVDVEQARPGVDVVKERLSLLLVDGGLGSESSMLSHLEEPDRVVEAVASEFVVPTSLPFS